MPRKKPVSPELSSASVPRNFTLGVESSVRALTIGVPSYAARRRRIEDGIDDLLTFLGEHEAKLSRTGMSYAEVARTIEAAARKIDFTALNRLVDAHNRYYPIEANLPIDPRTGAYMIRRGTPFEPEPALGPDRLLALYAALGEEDD